MKAPIDKGAKISKLKPKKKKLKHLKKKKAESTIVGNGLLHKEQSEVNGESELSAEAVVRRKRTKSKKVKKKEQKLEKRLAKKRKKKATKKEQEASVVGDLANVKLHRKKAKKVKKSKSTTATDTTPVKKKRKVLPIDGSKDDALRPPNATNTDNGVESHATVADLPNGKLSESSEPIKMPESVRFAAKTAVEKKGKKKKKSIRSVEMKVEKKQKSDKRKKSSTDKSDTSAVKHSKKRKTSTQSDCLAVEAVEDDQILTQPGPESQSAADEKVVSSDQVESGVKNEKKAQGRSFRRVADEEWLGKKGAWDNSYEATFGNTGWGAKAQQVLSTVRGRNFRHQKTKKKRGTYFGGKISIDAVNSIKFNSDDE